MPRGNTLDNRYSSNNVAIAATTASSHAVASHTTTVGLSSHNGSRPSSAVKKK